MKKTPKNTKQNKKKWMFLSLGLAATGALSYFGWQYYITKSQEDGSDSGELFPGYSIPSSSTSSATNTTSSSGSSATSSSNTSLTQSNSFPLKKGNKGEKVKQLQQSLIAANGASILPKYGADGDFGTETVNALKKLKLPSTIDETTFNVIVKTATVNPAAIAKQLYDAAKSKNYASAISLLKTIKSTADYSAVSNEFVKYNLAGVNQTLVNGMLNSFSTESQKQEIRLAFAAMGLKYNGDKWSLSGFGQRQLITARPTKVWINPKSFVTVPSKMVLGNVIETRANFTLFENQGQYFLVESNNVNYYN